MSGFKPEFQPPIKPAPTDPAEIHFRKAWQCRKHKQFEEAVREFKESLKHNPNKAATHFNLGLTYDDLGDGRQATAHAELALKLFTQDKRVSNITNAQKLLNKFRKKYPGRATPGGKGIPT